MRLLAPIVALVVAVGGTARADSHADMARALVAHADLAPPPAALPGTKTTHAAVTPAVRTAPTHGDQGRGHGDKDDAASLAHHAQEAAAQAAGQAQAAAAKARASHPHPH